MTSSSLRLRFLASIKALAVSAAAISPLAAFPAKAADVDLVVGGTPYTVVAGAGAGQFTITDTGGNAVANGTNFTNADAITITAATLKFGAAITVDVPIKVSADAGNTIDVAGFNAELSGVISNDGAVVGVIKYDNSGASAKTLTLSADNTYTGATTIAGSTSALTVKITDVGALGDDGAGTTGTTTITTGGTLSVETGNATTVIEAFDLNGGTLKTNEGAGAAETITLSGDIAVTANSIVAADTQGTLKLTGTISGDDQLTIGIAAGAEGTVELSGTNTFTGDVVQTTNSTLKLSSTGALGSSVDITTVANSTLDVDQSVTVGSITGAGAIDVATSKTLTFGNATDTTLSGVISGAGGITKQGSSTVTLSGANTYTGTTTINAGSIKLGASNSIKSGNSVTISGGTLDLNGKNPSLSVTMTSGTISGGLLSGSLDSRGGTITNVTGDSAFTQTSGTTTVTGSNKFSSITMNGGTLSVSISDPNTTPITNTGTFSYSAGTISVDASSAASIGEWTILTGDVPDAVASNTEVTFQGRTLSFSGFDAPIAGLALYDVYLKKGSLKFVSERKLAGDVCGITGLCSSGPLNGSLSGADKTAVSQVIKDVVWPSFESTELTFGFYTGQKDFSEYVISGLMPRNIDAAGNSLSHYNDLLADTIFRRQPLRKFTPVAQASSEGPAESTTTVVQDGSTTTQEILIEPAVTSTPEIASTTVENTSLTAQYIQDDKWSAWVRGLGGEYKGDNEGTYVYRDYSATYGGVLLGVDYEVASDVRLGAYANNGYITMTQSAGDITGSGSWDPTGWGGGITASYTKQNFYVQGLFGASGFSGTQKRSVVDVGATVNGSTVLAQTIEGDKDVTSFVGSVRVGAPFDLGKFFLEPQLTATWTGNQESAFTEKSGDTMKLRYGGRTTNFLQTELGAKFTMPINLGKKSEIVPNIRLAWLGDWGINSAGQQIGYTFTNRTTTIESDNQTDMGMLIEGGVDYTIANTDSVSYKVYALGGVELYENNGTGWRASGGFGINF